MVCFVGDPPLDDGGDIGLFEARLTAYHSTLAETAVLL